MIAGVSASADRVSAHRAVARILADVPTLRPNASWSVSFHGTDVDRTRELRARFAFFLTMASPGVRYSEPLGSNSLTPGLRRHPADAPACPSSSSDTAHCADSPPP